ncbi:NADPH-dependent glutamate synthase [Megalodesulfovibrio gigas]|uniref:Putative glutamate synthase (NADPH), homotetrameric n=1 Tax=Megalodesulfovibrio gigas (strain ATCC 19364 / DSM 1382 / NCIMB 9332 / VKM B-1759) TaxID=1121448 RepID=T2GC69_MEGG1|nr:NADPH-dependent glutamate synthase [Megalodesulfovibrio gigas]AGW13507.1 putative glutamate synthase (NADPH), homotetrameric [Megalodesulfovibrio gigas DSM 1382 = ATCC 19364]
MASSESSPKKGKSPTPRVPMPTQEPLARIKNFAEVALGYAEDQALIEASRCIQCKKPLCVQGCPVEVPIRDFIAHLQKNDVQKAYEVIKSTNSLPAVCGRVCPQETQCEGNCILGKKGEPVAIGRLERYVADTYMALSACDQITGKPECPLINEDLKVACIGSGPSSLTAAGYLAARGIKVTVFEALHEVGGVLIYGIPEFRLPKGIVAAEVAALKEQQVDLLPNWVGGKTFTIKELFDEGYKAVFIGVGAGLPKFLGIPGENLIGVFSANEYLTRANLGRAYDFPHWDTPTFPGRRVAVLGGGNVAMDAARTALRLGAEEVRIVYRRTQGEMPARHEELEHAVEEGVILEILSAPVEFKGDSQGRLTSMVIQKMELGEPDASGRRSPVPIEGAFQELACDMAVIAVGAGPNPILLDSTPELKRTRRGYIDANQDTGETSMPMVFAGGDIVTGAATVISAMGAGRRAAKEIARRLLGEDAA